MSPTHSRLPIGIDSYSFAFSCGYVRRDGRPPFPRQLRVADIIALAIKHKLNSIEIPLVGMLPDLSDATLDDLRAQLDAAQLGLVFDSGVINVAALSDQLPRVARIGVRTVRATLSSLLEGARATLPGGWAAHMAEMHKRLLELRPVLETHNITLALENHQDATSDDLLELCAAGGDHVGITFDVVNPLAVGEEPFAFARKIGHRIRNVHLKDYQIYPTLSGYRLVRAALGHGVIDWAAMLLLLSEVAPTATLHIELAALYARHIRLLEDDWWQGYPPQDVRDLLPTLRFVAENLRPAHTPWETPWELNAPDEEVEQYEIEQFEASVAHMRSIVGID